MQNLRFIRNNNHTACCPPSEGVGGGFKNTSSIYLINGVVLLLVLGMLCTCVKVPDSETPVTLTVSKESLTFPASGEQQTFAVTSNASWTLASDAPWFTVSPSSSGSNGTVSESNEAVTVTVTASSNTATVPRTATITINSSVPGVPEQTVNVMQAAITPALSVSLSSLNVAATGEAAQTFSITSNINWTVHSNAS